MPEVLATCISSKDGARCRGRRIDSPCDYRIYWLAGAAAKKSNSGEIQGFLPTRPTPWPHSAELEEAVVSPGGRPGPPVGRGLEQNRRDLDQLAEARSQGSCRNVTAQQRGVFVLAGRRASQADNGNAPGLVRPGSRIRPGAADGGRHRKDPTVDVDRQNPYEDFWLRQLSRRSNRLPTWTTLVYLVTTSGSVAPAVGVASQNSEARPRRRSTVVDGQLDQGKGSSDNFWANGRSTACSAVNVPDRNTPTVDDLRQLIPRYLGATRRGTLMMRDATWFATRTRQPMAVGCRSMGSLVEQPMLPGLRSRATSFLPDRWACCRSTRPGRKTRPLSPADDTHWTCDHQLRSKRRRSRRIQGVAAA